LLCCSTRTESVTNCWILCLQGTTSFSLFLSPPVLRQKVEAGQIEREDKEGIWRKAWSVCLLLHLCPIQSHIHTRHIYDIEERKLQQVAWAKSICHKDKMSRKIVNFSFVFCIVYSFMDYVGSLLSNMLNKQIISI
jgi:hypothetical protein